MNKLFKMLLLITMQTFFCVDGCHSQGVLEDLAEQVGDGDINVEFYMEELSDYLINPLNINEATKEDLESFPFLSDRLIENILYYLYKYGPMMTNKELMMVEGMDKNTFQLLKYFIIVKQPHPKLNKIKLKNLVKYGKHDLISRIDIPLYKREGYKKTYKGYPYHHTTRYQFHYNTRVYAGITMENDAGEPFFSGTNKKGFDFYSPYLYMHNIGRIHTFVLGNYRVNYGYGMVVNTNFSLGKTVSLNTLLNRNTGLKKHSSTDEFNYLQGTGISYQLSKRWKWDVFYSYRKMDGTVDNLFIRSLKKDGLHRTTKEIEKNHTLNNQLIGSHLDYNGSYIEWGLTSVYNVFNKVLNPVHKYYNTFDPRGRDFLNIGMNYKIFMGKFSVFGETALDKKGRIASLNILRYLPNIHTQIIVMNRWYDMKFQSLYARSVAEGGRVQNENAFYIGLETKLLRNVFLNCYGDFFYFPYKKYLISKAGTKGFDGVVQLTYSPRYELNMFIKYKYKNKPHDYTMDKEKFIGTMNQHRLRYQLNYSEAQWNIKTIMEYNRIDYSYKKPSQGYLVSQHFGYSWKKIPLILDATFSWFNTDDYASRISVYEKGLLYSFSIPSFYDKGFRIALNARYEIFKNVILQCKFAETNYLNKQEIGTGLDRIPHHYKQDVYLQIRWKIK